MMSAYKAQWFMLSFANSGTSNSSIYTALNGQNNTSTATESLVQQLAEQFGTPFVAVELFATAVVNTKDQTTTIGFRLNGATVTGSTVTYATTVTGRTRSGVFNQLVTAADLINGIWDTSTSGAGTLNTSVNILCRRA